MKATIQIDSSRIPKGVNLFDGITKIEISKAEIFKYGIFKEEIQPDHVFENDFKYLLSQIPAYDSLFSGFIEIKPNQIVNKSSDDRKMKDISEVVGIALGLKLATEALGIDQRQIEKIPPPPSKEKYLDYKVVHEGNEYEIETKGTTQNSVQSFVNDIAKKKKNKPKVYFRFGTVAQIGKPNDNKAAILHLCDDPPKVVSRRATPISIYKHYLSPLSHVIDNKYYNKLVKFFSGRKKHINIYTSQFFGKYKYQGEEYFGDYFDHRHIQEILFPLARESKTIEKLFSRVTKQSGKNKIFIGINSRVLSLLFKKEYDDLADLNFDARLEESRKSIIFRDSDGIIIVKSINGADSQIEQIFTEEEVKRRMGYLSNWFNHVPSTCGAPCRSREKEGKSCAIKTYRGHCHFHR